ncbi:MAG: DUF4867 family protein [Lachnospiraceae bacterium]|nr:DUF4867 family protein [Lachnospiraceae bacterium]
MKIQNVTDKAFKKYGKVVTGIDFSDMLAVMKQKEIPADVVYEPGLPELEACASAKDLCESVYGGMPIQVGHCSGNNNKLNAVEYHRDSEVNISVDGMILLLGKEEDIEDDYTYDTANIEAFLVPAGVAVELYATTLHYAPCNSEKSGFRGIVVLPKGTNYELTKKPSKTPEDKLITHVNKWLIAHEDAKIAGAFNGLKGENITL